MSEDAFKPLGRSDRCIWTFFGTVSEVSRRLKTAAVPVQVAWSQGVGVMSLDKTGLLVAVDTTFAVQWQTRCRRALRDTTGA